LIPYLVKFVIGYSFPVIPETSKIQWKAVNTDSFVKVTDAERDLIETELKSLKKTTSRAQSVVGEPK